MRWSLQPRRRFSDRPGCFWEVCALEARQLLSGETVSTIPSVLANIGNPAANSITLNNYFNDATLPGTLATFQTNAGEIQVALTDAATPQTVANFLNYVNSGAYTDTIIHRSADLNTNQGGTPQAPGTIIQGGGYTVSNGGLAHIAVNAPVADEYSTELYGNFAGTLAEAKTSAANSGTSEWYFNVVDNTELDSPTFDSNGSQTSYTVFGRVLSGSDVISTIAGLPTTSFGNGLDTVPVGGLTEAQIAAGATITSKNLVFTTSITTEAGTTYSVTSSNKTLVTPKVTDGVLSFSYSSTLFGTAEITIKGSNLDGTSTSTVVDVTVPNPATPGAGPVVPDFTAPFTQTGTTGNFSVLTDATDSDAALNPASVTIVTGPTNGTATVDAATGHINYTPASGFLGSDTIKFTVTDANGTTSSIATATVDSVPGPATVTIGTAKAKTLTFTEPDGVVSHLTIASGVALITFADYRVDLKTVNGNVFASGAGTSITQINVTDRITDATLTISSNGPVQLGPIRDQFHLSVIAPAATLTGTSTIGSSKIFKVAALVGANLSFSTSPVPINLQVDTVTNSSVTSANSFSLIRSKAWLNTDGGDYTLSAPQILTLQVTGTFAEKLNLTGKGYNLVSATIATPTAAWALAGSAFVMKLGTPGAAWSLLSNGYVGTLAIKGDLTNSIQAAAIGTMTVTGTSIGATIQTDATFSKSFQQIKKLAFLGAVSNTVIFSAGNLGGISAPSFTNCRIYAGVVLTAAQNGQLAASAADLTDNARITSVTAASISDCLITADILGSLKLGKIATTTNGTSQGIAAHTIGSITGILTPGGTLKAAAAQLKNAAALKAYETAAKLTLGNFVINLF